MTKYVCDCCGSDVPFPDTILAYSGSNTVIRKDGNTMFLLLCDDCRQCVIDLLESRSKQRGCELC